MKDAVFQPTTPPNNDSSGQRLRRYSTGAAWKQWFWFALESCHHYRCRESAIVRPAEKKRNQLKLLERRWTMPQLGKGGKHTFGWSRVGGTGRIVIPPEALEEYNLKESDKMILVPGSQTSGGFGLGSMESLKRPHLGAIMDARTGLGVFQEKEGEVIEYRGKLYCWVELQGGGVVIPKGILDRYGIKIGNPLLVIRGSGLAIGFAVRGPIIEEAKKHPELEVYEPET